MAEAEGTLDITVGGGGWLRIYDPQQGLRAFVRFDPADDGRLYPAALLADAFDPDGDEKRALRGADLRTFPLGAVEAAANGELREKILAKIASKTEVVFRKADGRTRKTPVGPRVTIEVSAEGRTHLSGRSATGTRAAVAVTVPKTRPYPDSFFADVAIAYREIAGWSQRPAAEIAEAAGVPVKTVHGWVAQARKRGYLPPGRRGKVG